MIRPLEEAGYGIVVYDYPFNQAIRTSCDSFRRDLQAFRKQAGETQPWAILAHSMGALVARSYIEENEAGARDVSSLLMIAPVNQGAHVARIQPFYQTVTSLLAINSKRTTQALSQLSDGIGQAADDMLPGSAFLKSINARPRAKGVRYHIVAGDRGLLTNETREKAQARLEAVAGQNGLMKALTSVATREMNALLDELTDGTGDGCVSVEHTRLDGVADHVTISANHAELIRAPILFEDDGPVVSMPHLLRWLREDLRPSNR
jgi:pimeloyl-ACP methyl ester carboxylesterase